MVRHFVLLDRGLGVRVREKIATLFVEYESSNGFKAEVFGHELTHFLEESHETSLGADLRCQLQGVDHGLLLLVDFLLGLDFLHLHGKVGAQNLEYLLISLMEAYMFVLALDYPRFTLNHKDDLVILKYDWMSQMSLIFQSESHFFDFLEARLG